MASRFLQALCFIALIAPCPQVVHAEPSPASERQMSTPRTFEGVYVTNFEISYFVECRLDRGDCDDWLKGEVRWLGVARSAEAHFLQCIVRWNGSHMRWALYAISFKGRETLERRPKQFLHDTEHYVVVDEVEALEMIGTDDTVEWALPRFRRRPTMKC